ncbi:uncharacterized protein LOC100846861 [Brachypodium distachyon]|uniref:uncharacterized protein LOC100846861 n=1 Tax=Brachypodium distachyon TaxID=15368 RepID=UPI000D0CDE36|nr:uncharacterized protein LOC100846861 [Brachypodium distachyon]|eukprot:XP_024313199.1 uncharacterized protein LOC100846861 [Brachypodium distachyon]
MSAAVAAATPASSAVGRQPVEMGIVNLNKQPYRMPGREPEFHNIYKDLELRPSSSQHPELHQFSHHKKSDAECASQKMPKGDNDEVLKVLREIWSKQDSLERQFVDHRDIVQAELKKIGISDNSTEFATEKDYFEFCDNSTECKAGCEEPDLTLEGSAQLEGSGFYHSSYIANHQGLFSKLDDLCQANFCQAFWQSSVQAGVWKCMS